MTPLIEMANRQVLRGEVPNEVLILHLGFPIHLRLARAQNS